VRPCWLEECVIEGKIIHKQPAYMIACTAGTQQQLDDFADDFGDCYTERTTLAGLQNLFDGVRDVGSDGK
jgi:hypothetical protein